MVTGLKHQKKKRSMEHVAGLDVSVNETNICIVDETGRIVREGEGWGEPEALLAVLMKSDYHFKRIICVETRHMRAVLQAQIDLPQRWPIREADIGGTSASSPPRTNNNGAATSCCPK